MVTTVLRPAVVAGRFYPRDPDDLRVSHPAGTEALGVDAGPRGA